MAASKPAPAQETPTPAPDGPPAAAGGPGVYEYTDEVERTYQFHDGTVVTPQKGDVCPIPYDPGDKRWTPTTREVTRLPDNHPEQIPINQAAAAKARAQAIEAATETGKAAQS